MTKLWTKPFTILLKAGLYFSLIWSCSSKAKVYDFTEDNQLTLLEDARAAVDLKIELVKSARHHIHIMTYYWDKSSYPMVLINELRKAHDRGVDVRIISTYIPSLAVDFWRKADKELFTGFDQSLSKSTLAYLKFTPGRKESITNNIHEKIFLVDGEKAIIGGRNVSDNDYRAKDLEVLLEGPVVNQIQTHFQKMFTFVSELKIDKSCQRGTEEFQSNCKTKILQLNFKSDDDRFFPEQPKFKGGVRARILTNEVLFDQHLTGTKGDARFEFKDDIIDTVVKINFNKMRAYNYFIIPTERYKNFLLKNLALGKSIDIMTNSMVSASAISDKGYKFGLPEMRNLVSQGLNLFQWLGTKVEEGKDKLFYLHEKVMLFDDDHGIIGSHNFGAGSTSVSSEIAIEFYSAPVVGTLNAIFDQEKESNDITKVATIPMLDEEIKNNRTMIQLLHSAVFRNFVQEVY